MKKRNQTYSLILLVLLLVGCKQIDEQEKYLAPNWLSGKIYTQLKTLPELSAFTECVELTAYDAILDVSGSYTVLAPNNEAFQKWFDLNPEYNNSLENVPLPDLVNLVERHIVQNGWSSNQLRSLDTEGWIDPSDPNNNAPGGYKRQTILENADKKYFVNFNDEIVDSTSSSEYKKVFTSSRKYAPFYYSEYLAYNKLSGTDYSFYYDRDFDIASIYYRNAKLIGEEIFAENGFIYEVDEVTPPLYNAEEILEEKKNTYSIFRSMINKTSVFQFNEQETKLQPDALAGNAYDNLFDLSYEGLTFFLNDELTGPDPYSTSSNNSVRYHNCLLAPSNEAITSFFSNVLTTSSGLPHWQDVDNVPDDVMLTILNAHMAINPVYASSLSTGFINGVGDRVTLEETSISEKFDGSNCSFLGLNEAIVPRAFSSVSGPIYLRPGYSVMRQAVDYTNILPALKKEENNYSFYIISDTKLREDSILFAPKGNASFRAFNRSALTMSNLSRADLTNILLNHVGTRVPSGSSRKEFIENLAGNYIVVNNEKQIITGGLDSKYGYLGDSTVTVSPVELEEIADNGQTYEIGTWLNFPKSSMYSSLLQYPHFVQLIKDAELFDAVYNTFTFLTDKEFYTVLVPSKEALEKINLDSLSLTQKQELVKHHFIRGQRIWTDGSSLSGKYKTLSLDKTSSQYNKRYEELDIETASDIIRILNDNGEVIYEINEQEGKSNQMISSQLNGSSGTQYDYAVTAAMHEIDTVLINY